MDVRCGRCGTEYEFDDALISERGTTVKCTNCGHQFKVYPAQTSMGVPERWVVRTTSGRELVYTSLRDLQKGITQRQVGPEDTLSRGNQSPRPLGAIAELEPFFHGTPMHAPKQPGTLHGVAPPANPAESPSGRPQGTLVGGFNASATARMDPHGPALAPQGFGVVVPRINAEAARARVAPSSDVDPLSATAPLDSQTDPPTIPRPVAVPERPVSAQRVPVADPTPTPASIREALRSYEDISSEATELPGVASRRARSRWIAGVVLLGIIVLFGATLGRSYMKSFAQPAPPASEAAPDGRVAGMLDTAGRMLDEGDLEGARGQLDQATALGANNPAVISALARLETIRADLFWLKLRLLDPANQDLVADTNQQLGHRVGKARVAVDRATAVAATDPTVIRARIDLLRLARELPEARKLVGPLSQNASQPENAYVLAALDLAEQAPVWSSIIDRLRTASAAERELGRARAALIYALIRSGDVTQAKSELGKLETRSKSHQLLTDLQSFVGRHSAPPDAGPNAKKEVATVDPSTLPLIETKGGPDIEPRDRPGDVRTKLKEAHAALSRGDYGKAEALFRSVLAQHPKNTEALSGLGDVAKARRDPATAGQMYEQALRDNPTYIPAMIAQADHKWDNGDRKGAIALYRRVLEQAGAGSEYGQRAAARIAQGEGGGKEPSERAPSEKPAGEKPAGEQKPAEAPSEKKPDEKPHIDTTDLPEFNK
jgi:predicted Zn finger-like uncharacterized protein